jgi:hypothetical protein
MKMLSPAGSVRSVGRNRWWTPLIAVASISCLPLCNLLADQPNHGQKGGQSKAGSGHQSAAHGGGVSRPANTHQGGYHAASANRNVSPHHEMSANRSTSSHHQEIVNRSAGSHHEATVNQAVSSHRGSDHRVANETVSSHQAGSHRNGSTAAASRQPRSHEKTVAKTTGTRQNNSELRNTSPGLRKGSSTNSRTSLYSRNNNSSRGTNRMRTLARETTYNHSLTQGSVHNLMNRRLTEIGNRHWTGHGIVFSSHSDPKRGYWYQHGGYWWRCNFWGARSYCDHLIVLGQPPGLCWAWYDDICWGNIVIGMPFGLIDYYYPDAVSTADTSYDGDAATVYYYEMDNGQYKQVTVVDGDVVDVEIVDHIA